MTFFCFPGQGVKMLEPTRSDRIRETGHTVFDDRCALNLHKAAARLALKLEIEPHALLYLVFPPCERVAGEKRYKPLFQQLFNNPVRQVGICADPSLVYLDRTPRVPPLSTKVTAIP